MKDIIKWLRKIEKMAGKVYLLGAEIYDDDPEFKKFLEDAAEEEAWHYHVMGSAAEYLVSRPAPIPAISIDETTSGKILKYMSDMKDGLESHTISKDELVQKIVEVELLEWNDIFIYVVNVLKEQSSEFKYSAARIQAHIKEIEYFLNKVYKRPDLLDKIKEVPPVWVENILIVDDEQLITDLIKSLLNRSGNIDVAQNGQEALKLIEEKFYKLIICDIDMPIMDGLSFFKEAVAKYPKLKSRFLYITGYLSKEKRAFFSENRVKYLEKPMHIKVLREEASKIILSK
jgi:CheY-like chemotaxis protein